MCLARSPHYQFRLWINDQLGIVQHYSVISLLVVVAVAARRAHIGHFEQVECVVGRKRINIAEGERWYHCLLLCNVSHRRDHLVLGILKHGRDH